MHLCACNRLVYTAARLLDQRLLDLCFFLCSDNTIVCWFKIYVELYPHFNCTAVDIFWDRLSFHCLYDYANITTPICAVDFQLLFYVNFTDGLVFWLQLTGDTASNNRLCLPRWLCNICVGNSFTFGRSSGSGGTVRSCINLYSRLQ